MSTSERIIKLKDQIIRSINMESKRFHDFNLQDVESANQIRIESLLCNSNQFEDNILLIEGVQGSGKTTLSEMISISFYKNNLVGDEFDLLLPVYSDYNIESKNDPYVYIKERYLSDIQTYDKSIPLELEKRSNSKRILWMIDDFDQLDDMKKKDLLERVNKKEIRDLIVLCSNMDPQIKATKHFELMGLKSPLDFIEERLDNNPRLKRILLSFFSKYQNQLTVVNNPYCMEQLLEMASKSKDINFAKIYKNIFADMLQRNNLGYKQIEIAKRILAEMSAYLFKKATREFSEKEFVVILEKYQSDGSIIQAQKILQVFQNFGLIKKSQQKNEQSIFKIVLEDIFGFFAAIGLAGETERYDSLLSLPNMTTFLGSNLKDNPIRFFSLFNRMFAHIKLKMKDSYCQPEIISIFSLLNQLSVQEENKKRLKKAIKKIQKLSQEVLIDASRDLNHDLFDLFDLSGQIDEKVIDECLKSSIHNHLGITLKLLDLKLNTILQNRKKEYLYPFINKIDRIKQFIGNQEPKQAQKEVLSLLSNELTSSENISSDRNEISHSIQDQFKWENILTQELFEFENLDFNKRDSLGRSFISSLSQTGNVELAERILKTKQVSFFSISDQDLLDLFEIGNFSMARVCVKYMSLERIRDILLNLKGTLLFLQLDNPEVISILIERFLDKPEILNSFLLEALKNDKRVLIGELLKKEKVSFSYYLNEEPIFHTLFREKEFNYTLFDEFCEKQTDLNLKNSKNQNVMHLACEKEDLELIRRLIKCKVFQNEIDNQGYRPLDLLKTIKTVDCLIELGFRPHKDGGTFLLKNLFSPNVDSHKEPKNKNSCTIVPGLWIDKEEEEILRCLINYLDSSQHETMLNYFIKEKKVEERFVKILIKRALYCNPKFFQTKSVFETLFYSHHKKLFLENHYLDPKMLVETLNNKNLNDNFMQVKQIIEHDEKTCSELFKNLPDYKKLYMEEVMRIVNEENKELKEMLALLKVKIIQQYSFLELGPSSNSNMNMIFLNAHGKSKKSKILNNGIKEILLSLSKSPIKKYLNIEIVEMDEWKEKRKELDPWIVFICSEMVYENHFCLGENQITFESFLNQFSEDKTVVPTCVYLNLIDTFGKYENLEIREENSFPNWIIEEKVSTHTEMKNCITHFFDFLYNIVGKKLSILDSCRNLRLIDNQRRIKVLETFNFSLKRDGNLYKKKNSNNLQSGTYFNFRNEVNLKRAGFFINLVNRKFGSKNIEYFTLFKKFSEPNFKNKISFYNASPYSSSSKDTYNILERIDRSVHPWLVVACFSVWDNKIIVEYENEIDSTSYSIENFNSMVADKIGFPTCCIFFQNIHIPSQKNNNNFLPSKTGGYDLLNTSMYNQLSLCADVVIVNEIPIKEEEKQWFLEKFFEYMESEKCSLQAAFYFAKENYSGPIFPMKMVSRPIDFILESSVQKFFLDDRYYKSYDKNQRVKEEKMLLKACSSVDVTHLDYFQSLNYFGVNSVTSAGRSLLITTLMKDLFETAMVLLNYEDIDVDTIDPLSGKPFKRKMK